LVVIGLWDTILRYMRLRDINRAQIKNYETSEGDYNMQMYYNNFEVSSTHLWQSKAYQDFFEYLDRTGGILLRRWGDSPIRTLALAVLFPDARIEQWHGLCYYHAGVKWTL